MKTLLITGHRGLLGSACVRRFKEEYDILTYDVDLRDYERTSDWFRRDKPDYVINCAARVGGVKANRDFPVEFIEDNLAIQTNVIKCSYEVGAEKLVMVGTSCIYPKHAPLPVSEESLLTGPFEPDVEAYATAKLAGLALCRAYSKEYGKRFMTVCPSNIYGPNDNYGVSAHVIPSLIHRAHLASIERKPLRVWGDGSQVREFIYADDAANAIAFVLDHWNSAEPINIGTGIGTSIRSLVETLLQVSNLNLEVQWDTSQPTGIYRKTFNVDKLRKLGYGPLTSLPEGLLRTWVSYLETPNPRLK